MPSNIQGRIAELKTDLIKSTLTYEEIFQKHIVDGNTFFFNDYLNDKAKEYKTKSLIAEYLGVHIHEIIFVGSSKLGYSLNPQNLFNEFDSKFKATKLIKDKSDLDIAIVSENCFDSISEHIFEYTNAFKTKWEKNDYYSGDRLLDFSVPLCYKYFEYFSKGWFRPDMQPSGYDFCVKNSFQELKRKFFVDFNRKIGLGIYKNWYFFKHYHIKNIRTLSYRVKTEPL